jgi:hypothetical protein
LLPASGREPSPRRLALAGALVGLSVVFEYQALFAAVLVAGFAAYQLRAGVWPFFLGALGPALLLGAYHTVLLGRPWELPYAHLDDPGYATYHHSQGFLGLGRPRARILGIALFSVDYGLFAYAPLLAAGFALSVWAALRRGDAAAALTVLVTAVMAVFLSGMANWRGGWCAAGPRYIAVVVPFLVFAVARSFREVIAPRPLAVLGVAVLAFVSIGLCGLSALFPHFPVQLDNPIFDLVLPLIAQGYVPHGLGTALGLSGLGALLPWLLVMVGAIALGARGLPGGARGAGLAVIVAALALGALSTYGKKTREDARVRGFIEKIWEPRPPGATKGATDGPA